MTTEVVYRNSEFVRNNYNEVEVRNSLFMEENLTRLFDELTDEAREDLFCYLERNNLVDQSGMLVIPSTRHFYYDAEDMKGVKTVVNLKQLNHVREIRDFLKRMSELLPDNSNFVGCFIDNKNQNGFSVKYNNLPHHLSKRAIAFENGIESKIPLINRMYSFIDSRTNLYLTRRVVSHLLEECGFELVGMTELNGLTYFRTQKIKPAA